MIAGIGSKAAIKTKCILNATRTIFTDILYESINTPKIPVRNVPFLPGSSSLNLPEHIANKPHKELRIVKVNPSSTEKLNLLDIGKYASDFVEDNVNKTPAILFKSLPISEVEQFNDFTKEFGYKSTGYKGGNAHRSQLADNVFAASDEPPAFSIEHHNEMSYLEHRTPTKIMFGCTRAAEHGGESPVVFNRDLMKDLRKDVIEKFRRKKIRYYRNLPSEKYSDYITWQATFGADSKEDAEKALKSEGFDCRWNEDESLSIWNVVPALRKHPTTGEDIFFNQAQSNHCTYYYAHPTYVDRQHWKPLECHYHCSYGDGEEIEAEVLDHIRAVTWNNAVGLKLEKGDVLFLDNFLVQHSRMGYKHGKRKIAVHLMA